MTGTEDPTGGVPRAQGRGTRGRPRLGRAEWIAAAVDVLRRDGPGALGVEALAAALGVTKGSFYWHFASRADLLREALAVWEERATTAVIDENEAAGGDAATRLRRLLSTVTSPHRGALAETRLLAAATTDPLVAEVLERVVRRRIDYVAQLVASTRDRAVPDERDRAVPDERDRAAALCMYAAYTGGLQLALAVPGVVTGLDPDVTADLFLEGILRAGRA